MLVTILIGAFTGFVNGLFGSGGGTFLVPAMQKWLDVKTHKSHATAIAVILPLSIVSSFVYLKNGTTDLKTLLYVSIGGVVGGFVGAKCLTKVPRKYLHKVFGAFMIVAAVRMIF